ncbi:MAG: hypothetical protein JWQ81_6522 [Amycolatopsis sp.]|uniref:hypothetical protein n=1 Tax=Amycolatopsis sp. TaxID=37632 RepID=UPI00261F6E89|nr:hypothetical protein [Amycolatopsis sp.]MCU1685783.1 hypothetical protein [Amycolatopsis sp.]
MTYRDDRRADRVAAAEQARADADAASARRVREAAATAEQALHVRAALAEQARTEKAERDARNTAKRDARSARLAALTKTTRAWATEHAVDLLIYPLAVASAVMAIPSMGIYGFQVYRSATGGVLPLLSELGMWSFAIAVMVSRTRHPERPVWALQLGLWVFAGAGFALNVVHGLADGWSSAVVMGAASIAGVVAHQLLTASPRRSAAERAEARIARQAASKTNRIRLAAVRTAVADIDAKGNVALLFAPGRYTIGRTGRLAPATVAGLPVDPIEDLSDAIGDEVAAWLAEQDRPSIDPPTGPVDDRPGGADRGPIATLDPDDDQRKSNRRPDSIPSPTVRSMDDLRAELDALIEADPAAINLSANSIRKALRCSPKRAQQLRNERRPK